MELETLFSEQRWNILKSLSEGNYSPLQLAQKLNTTIANISQQLRLLEAANLVKTEKIPSRDKGKPRKLFSLRHDYVYLIPAMNGFAGKKLLELTEHHKITLRIWFLKNPELHYDVEKFYWKIEPYLNQIKFMAINQDEETEIVLVSDKSKEIEKKILPYAKEMKSKKISVVLLGGEEARRLLSQGKKPFSSVNEMSILFDPDGILSKLKKQA